MSQLISIVTILFLAPAGAMAITPQKYCESLTEASCEVLNIDFGSGSKDAIGDFGPIATIKYCRNRVFRTIPYELITDGQTSRQAPTTPSSNNKRKLRVHASDSNSMFLVESHLGNDLCAQTVLLSGNTVDVLP